MVLAMNEHIRLLRYSLATAFCALAIVSCGKDDSSTTAQTVKPEETVSPKPPETSAATSAQTSVATRQVKMNMSKKCAPDSLHQSLCKVEMILADISKNYSWIGGEVSEIKLIATNSYQITLPQNERADIFTYEFTAKPDGTVTMVSKTESTRSYQ
jgi:hypothetical protein